VYSASLRSVRVTILAVEKQQVLHILCVCVCPCVRLVSVALDIQYVQRMRRVTFSSLTFPAVLHFSTLSHNSYDFRKTVIEHQIDLLCNLCLKSFSLQ